MTALAHCHWHPDRETGLRCSSCGRSVCVECMRQHPVGVRCKECISIHQLPTHQAPASYVARGVAAAVGLGLGGAVGLALVLGFFPSAGFFYIPLMMGLGYLMGEGIGAAVNRRRGRPYQYVALLAVALATSPVWLSADSGVLSIGGLIRLGGVICAALIAWRRLEP